MNARIPLCMAQALAPFAPPSSVVHQIVSEDQALRIDLDALLDKKANGYDRRNDAAALRVQIERQGVIGGVL